MQTPARFVTLTRLLVMETSSALPRLRAMIARSLSPAAGWRLARAVLALAAGVLVAAGVAHAQDVTGAGASFPAPLYAQWADAYFKATGVKVNYQSVGSGAGLRQIRGRTVDFGASDMPLSDELLAKDGLLQFPTVIGGVVPVVNLKDVKPGELKLTGALLADIYLGKIKRWNDPAIAALNPGLPLPDRRIAVIRRADGSGTTFIFTHYLSKVSPEWRERVGFGTAVKWVEGAGGKGNEGVSAFVQRLPNSIGYVEYGYAKQTRMRYVAMQNAAGHFVEPDDAAFAAAAVGADWQRSFNQVLTNQAAADAWPISGATFILMHRQPASPARAKAVLDFFNWAYAHGGELAQRIDFVPLPAPVQATVKKSWGAIQAGGKPVWTQP